MERKFSVPTKIGQILAAMGVWGSGVSRSSDFYSKRHVLAWTHVVWAILRQHRSRGVTSKSLREKKPESHRASHRKDMSPLTQGLNCRSACDVTVWQLCSTHHPYGDLYCMCMNCRATLSVCTIGRCRQCMPTITRWNVTNVLHHGSLLPSASDLWKTMKQWYY